MKKVLSLLLLVFLGAVGCSSHRALRCEVKAVPPTTQESDRELTLMDYGFDEAAPVRNPELKLGLSSGSYSLLIVSPTVVRVVARPRGDMVSLPKAEEFAQALARIGRKRQIKHVVPITSTTRDEWERYADRIDLKQQYYDGWSRTHELIVITDDPRNPEKR